MVHDRYMSCWSKPHGDIRATSDLQPAWNLEHSPKPSTTPPSQPVPIEQLSTSPQTIIGLCDQQLRYNATPTAPEMKPPNQNHHKSPPFAGPKKNPRAFKDESMPCLVAIHPRRASAFPNLPDPRSAPGAIWPSWTPRARWNHESSRYSFEGDHPWFASDVWEWNQEPGSLGDTCHCGKHIKSA